MNTEPLTFIPPEMSPWGLQLVTPEPSEFGQFVLIGIEQASIETHHQVEVVDEDGRPMAGVGVIFGFPGGGPSINMPVRINHWRGSPTVLQGNGQKTNSAGYAQHTFATGGEDIFVWHRNKDGDLLYPSPIVRNCTSVRTPVGNFEHTGVKIRFALRRTNVIPAADRLSALEAWVTNVEGRLAALEGKREE